jgi:hypothetical protein
MLNRILFALALAIGLAIAYVDSRPTWDDAGITAVSLLLAAAIFGLIAPQRPWLWGVAIGIWIPLHQIARAPRFGAFLGAVVILAFPMVGAYAGKLCRRLLATP